MKKTRIAIIGCGNISTAYFKSCKQFSNLEVAACADLDIERARAQAAGFEIPKACTVSEILADPSIELAVNLTIPKAHAEIDCACLEAGKHVFSEKPFALTRSEGENILTLAAAKGLRVGCAPDTNLGSGIQSCRQLIDQDAIGRPVSFSANMICGGHESWHPSPEFYYQQGGGPLFDMGPYYLHALITLLGPVKSVSGSTTITFPTRTITSEPKNGTIVTVEVPTHIVSILEFHNGAIGTLVTSFDVRGGHRLPEIEIYGTTGSLVVPDPNGTNGEILLKKADGKDWVKQEPTHLYRDGSRGVGVADMASAIATGRAHRANETIAMHALDIQQAIHEASDQGRKIIIGTTCDRPEPMRTDIPEFTLD